MPMTFAMPVGRIHCAFNSRTLAGSIEAGRPLQTPAALASARPQPDARERGSRIVPGAEADCRARLGSFKKRFERFQKLNQSRSVGASRDAGRAWRPPGLPCKPLQDLCDLRRMPMTATSGRSDSALVKRRSDAVQARYPSRLQLRDDWRQISSSSVGACRSRYVSGVRGAVAQMATGWHCGSVAKLR
jgi:hypothetical protein